MATLLYGGRPNADVEAGNRADTVDMIPVPPPQTFALSPSFVPREPPPPTSAAAPSGVAPTAPEPPPSPGPAPTLPPMRPIYPTPSPWGPRAPHPHAFRSLVLGLLAAAALFGGLTLFGIALAWSHAMTRFAHVALMVIGGYLVAAGVAYVVSRNPETTPSRA
jgi:hypothetical protein